MTTTSQVKRSQFATFMDTTPSDTPTYALIGDGITSAEISYNPETEEYTFIHQDSGTTNLKSYSPSMPIEAIAVSGDSVFDFVDELRQSRAVLDAAKTTIVNVWLYEDPTGEAPNETYPAEQQEVIVSIESFGGEGGDPAKINYTLNYAGDPVAGTFGPTAKAFTANT